MIALQIMHIKDFMNKLLRSDMFDNFLLQEATITQGVTYTIDGALQKSFYTTDEQEELGLGAANFIPFSLVKNNCFDLIKGKKTPIHFKFIFCLSPDSMGKTLAKSNSGFTALDVTSMNIIFTFQGGKLNCTTGIAYKTFTMEKTLDHEWDTMVQKFLTKKEIDYETL